MILGKPNWTVGGGIKHSEGLLALNKKHKTYYDTPINAFSTVYDSIFGLKWNGGRICNPKDFCDLQNLCLLITAYNDMGVGFNFSFTNLLLKEKDLEDKACNELLQYANRNKLNGVIVASPLLKEYIAKTYPNLKLTWSVTTGLNKIELYNEACSDPALSHVVLHPDFNHDYEFLSKLIHPEKIEIMANDKCVFGCPFRRKHYLYLSELTLKQSQNPLINNATELDCNPNPAEKQGSCMAVRFGFERDGRNVLSFEDIDQLTKMGFSNFKIIGREYTWEGFAKEELDKYLGQYWLRTLVKEAGQGIHI